MVKKSKRRPMEQSASTRASISFPNELYNTLDRIAKDKKVSLAWVVREAAEKYVGDQWPLLREQRLG
jgi:metal-responsive CopG/Arc/MetJ family transcriptional regulator